MLHNCQIEFVDKLDEVAESQMAKDLVAYETSHGIDPISLASQSGFEPLTCPLGSAKY